MNPPYPLREIDVVKVRTSHLPDVDFDNLIFGSVFTDHMLVCDFVDGQWQRPQIKPYEPFQLDPSAKVFHYGQAIFEGMKAYKDDSGDVWLFRPDQNFERFNKSAIRMAMPAVPEAIFMGGLFKLIDLERNWVQQGKGNTLYIRPFMIATGTGVMAAPSNQYRFVIILSPAKAYYSGEVKVVIADYYSRAANGGIGAAKAAGNYSAQFYPQQLATEKGFQQIIWTDDATHTRLEEAGTMNVFFLIDGILHTAPVSDRILDGVTRKSLIDLARSMGVEVVERHILVSELVDGMKTGKLTEIFGAGTAAVVSPIAGFSYQDHYYELPKLEHSFASQLKEQLTNIQHKLADDPFGWTVKVTAQE